MRGIIWYYEDKDKAIRKLKEIINYNKKDLIRVRHSKNEYTAYFGNGDIWSIAPSHLSHKGTACNVSLISRDIPSEFETLVIRPATKSYPFQAIGRY